MLDRSRPATIKVVSSGPREGLRVAMYKDEPGVYRNDRGDEVDIADAAAAGFDVEQLAVEANVTRRTAEARRNIELEERRRLREIQLEEDPPFVAEHRGHNSWGVRNTLHADPKSEAAWVATKLEEPEARALAAELVGFVAEGLTPEAAIEAWTAGDDTAGEGGEK